MIHICSTFGHSILKRTNLGIDELCGEQVKLGGLVHNVNKEESIVKLGEFPWNAVIMRRTVKSKDKWKHLCGGTLINSDTVVTAAHCFLGKQETSSLKAENVKVLMGVQKMSDQNDRYRREFEVYSILMHGDWDPHEFRFTHDIALLKLSNAIETFSAFILPICLKKSKEIGNIRIGTVAGFGLHDETGTTSDIPRKVELPITTLNTSIKKQWKLAQAYWDESFTAGSDTAGICSGDSGSGFYVKFEDRYYLRGLVSASVYDEGQGCTHNNFAMYTDVLEYLDGFILPFAKLNKTLWTNLIGARKSIK